MCPSSSSPSPWHSPNHRSQCSQPNQRAIAAGAQQAAGYAVSPSSCCFTTCSRDLGAALPAWPLLRHPLHLSPWPRAWRLQSTEWWWVPGRDSALGGQPQLPALHPHPLLTHQQSRAGSTSCLRKSLSFTKASQKLL